MATTTKKYTLAQLQEELLNPANAYTPKTDEQIQQEAAQRYKSSYDAKRLAANQSAERNDLALANQLAGLVTSAERQSDEARKNTANSLSSYDRYALQRGMQRSSYNAAKLANIQAQGDKTLADIQQNLSNSQAGIEAQRAQIAGQLADQLAQYDISEQDDILAYIDQLKNTEYERNLAQQQYTDKLKMALYEYGLKSGGGVGGGSGSYGRSSSSAYGTQPVTDPTGSSERDLLNALNKDTYVYSTGSNVAAQNLLPLLSEPGTTPGYIQFATKPVSKTNSPVNATSTASTKNISADKSKAKTNYNKVI